MRILDVKVDNVTMQETVDRIGNMVRSGDKHYVVTPNAEFLVAAQRDPEFKRILNQADLSIPDGMGVVYASKFYGDPLRERVAGTDLVEILCKKAAKEGWSVFFLGGLYGVGKRAAEVLRSRYPGLNVCGFYEGKREKAYDEQSLRSIKRVSKGHKIDILLVAYGHNYQEKWIARNSQRLDFTVSLGIGGAFDFISGYISRAPLWVRRVGLEWLFRLIKQPWRWRRIFKAVVVFPFLVLKESFSSLFERRPEHGEGRSEKSK